MNGNEVLRLDQQLCRYPLLQLGCDGAVECVEGGDARPMVWFPVEGIQSFWQGQPLAAHEEVFRVLVASLTAPDARLAFAVCGTAQGVQLYYGCLPEDAAGLQASLQGLLGGIRLGDRVEADCLPPAGELGGVMVGQPGAYADGGQQGAAFKLPVDVLCSSMLGSAFRVQVLAERQSPAALLRMLENVRLEDQKMTRFADRTFLDSEGKQENRLVQDYMAHLQLAAADLERGLQEGMWSTTVFYNAEAEEDCERLEGILKSAWMGERSQVYQPLHCIPVLPALRCAHSGSSLRCAAAGCLPLQRMADCGLGVLDVDTDEWGQERPFNGYQLRTLLTGGQLARLCQLPRHEYPGYYVDPYVEFDTAARRIRPAQQSLALGNVVRADQVWQRKTMPNPYRMEVDDLTRHLLVVGITGGGKSNTSKAILSTLWDEHEVPFLVIESAKREYHQLVNLTRTLPDGSVKRVFPDLTLFTLGDENARTGIPYRLNPFEVMEGASIQTHIDYLLSTFKAAFELYPPMPYVLETAVYEVYSDRGWDIVENRNRYGFTGWPTLTDLYHKVEAVTDRLGYYEEVRSNVKAALRARINSLRIGGKGAMLDVPRSIPLAQLLRTPTVMELEDLGDDDSKAFVIGMLMVQLYEYRKSCPPSPHLEHLLVIEEAHRLLKKVAGGTEGDQSKAKSVEFFCNMLSEIRSYGQGIMICDQVPTRLADDALKNTNCKIVHRTVMEEDRTAVGRAMHMNEEQVDYLSSLPRGCAAVYAEGDSRPRLVRFPLMETQGSRTRQQVVDECRARMQQQYGAVYRVPRHSHACRFCALEECTGWEQCSKLLDRLDLGKYWRLIQNTPQKASAFNLVRLCRTAEQELQITLTPAEELCMVGALARRFRLDEAKQAALMNDYCRLCGADVTAQQS